MTWSKFDDAAPKNPKAVAAGNDAWALWAAAVMYCNRHNTDGYITLAALATDCLPRPISLSRAKKLAESLCGATNRPGGTGLFEGGQNGIFLIHDFLGWNPSKEEVEFKRKNDRFRKMSARTPLGLRSDSNGSPSGVRATVPADSETPRASPVPSRPVPEREDPPTPGRPPAAAHLRDTFSAGSAPAARADVQQVFEAWKLAFNRSGAAFRGPFDEDAYRIAGALAAHSLADCLIVAKYAPDDDKVSGRADENREKHESIRYIFGNEDAFSRILRLANKRAAEKSSESPSQMIARMKSRAAGSDL